MTPYYEALLASGATHDEAARHVYADTVQAWANREHPMYGRYNPDPPSAEEVRQAYEFKYGD